TRRQHEQRSGDVPARRPPVCRRRRRRHPVRVHVAEMKIGLFTPVFRSLGVKEMLAKVRSFGRIEAIEIGTGCWPGRDHIDLDLLLTDPAMSREYKQMIADAGLTISALSCHGNALHPDEDRAKADDEAFKKTIRLAERL